MSPCTENNENGSISNLSFRSFMPQILADYKTDGQAHDVFNIAYKWVRDCLNSI